MDAWMKMSRCTLDAADHTRGTGAIRGFVPCTLNRAEWGEAVRGPVINLSVVTTRLSMRSMNCDSTTNRVVRGTFHRQDSDYLKRSLLPHRWVPCETGNGMTVQTVYVPCFS